MIPTAFRRCHPFLELPVRSLVRLLAPRLKVTGRHNIPGPGAVVFAANHVADADPPILGSQIRYPLAWMAKSELWEIGYLKPFLDFLGCIPIDPESPDRAALKVGFKTLEAGEPIVIFPEGKLSLDGEIGSILPGALMLAMKSKAKVVPVGIWGTQYVIPYGSEVPRPTLKPVRIHFGDPISFDDLAEMPSRQAREIGSKRLEEGIRAAALVARGS